ncbi:hypothetical protein [Jatrophihabitans sp.]|uniref:hypothetical protein n=1 Tax=Jatrophihabitans sp. TaxID=1932789 RepID=UPI002BF45D8F|nr:hypothetical protein [Jatrophihabitans sp.]
MSSPRVFGLPHLSEDAVAAFADGVLSASAASRARRHCAECAECADAIRVQREAAMLLRTAQAPTLPSGLLDRLAGLPMSTPLPPPCGGLPTVLGADGTPVFVAHDVHKARMAGEHPDDGPATDAGRPAHRRGALPVTVLASAAAVVAAGTFGGHVSTLASSNRPIPAGAAQVAGALTGGQNPATGRNAANRNAVLGSSGSLIGTGAVLDTGLLPAGSTDTDGSTGFASSTNPAGPTSAPGSMGSAGDPAKPVVRPGTPLPPSVTVAPAHQTVHTPPAFRTLPAGFWSMVAGAPAATP